MRILYFDCFSGISGDMNLGAFIDLGMDPDYLREQLKLLHLTGYEIHIQKGMQKGIKGVKVDIEVTEKQNTHRHLPDIQKIIEESTLSPDVKKTSMAIFSRIAHAEALVHDQPLEKVHFHEVGALDSILDIVGAAIAYHHFQPQAVWASPVEVGYGMIQCDHGTLPVPAPATAEILKGVPLGPGLVPFEATTPTGAAILKTWVQTFTPIKDFSIEKVGYGLGSREGKDIPNALRLFLGRIDDNKEQVYIMECNLDDMAGEGYPLLMEKLLDQGALDVFFTPLIMKKGRPASKVSILCQGQSRLALEKTLFHHSTTLGVRYYPVARTRLDRNWKTVSTPWGEVRIKMGTYEGEIVQEQPEYEDCAKLAKTHDVPLQYIYREALKSLEEVKKIGETPPT